jgi:hypothetical protein
MQQCEPAPTPGKKSAEDDKTGEAEVNDYQGISEERPEHRSGNG